MVGHVWYGGGELALEWIVFGKGALQDIERVRVCHINTQPPCSTCFVLNPPSPRLEAARFWLPPAKGLKHCWYLRVVIVGSGELIEMLPAT